MSETTPQITSQDEFSFSEKIPEFRLAENYPPIPDSLGRYALFFEDGQKRYPLAVDLDDMEKALLFASAAARRQNETAHIYRHTYSVVIMDPDGREIPFSEGRSPGSY